MKTGSLKEKLKIYPEWFFYFCSFFLGTSKICSKNRLNWTTLGGLCLSSSPSSLHAHIATVVQLSFTVIDSFSFYLQTETERSLVMTPPSSLPCPIYLALNSSRYITSLILLFLHISVITTLCNEIFFCGFHLSRSQLKQAYKFIDFVVSVYFRINHFVQWFFVLFFFLWFSVLELFFKVQIASDIVESFSSSSSLNAHTATIVQIASAIIDSFYTSSLHAHTITIVQIASAISDSFSFHIQMEMDESLVMTAPSSQPRYIAYLIFWFLCISVVTILCNDFLFVCLWWFSLLELFFKVHIVY